MSDMCPTDRPATEYVMGFPCNSQECTFRMPHSLFVVKLFETLALAQLLASLDLSCARPRSRSGLYGGKSHGHEDQSHKGKLHHCAERV